MIELCVAAALLATLLSAAATMLGMVARQRRGAELRARALEAADNVLERLSAQPWETITSRRADELGLPAKVDAALPGAELRVDVTSPPEDPSLKRVDVSIAWSSAGRSDQGLRLTTFVARSHAP
jgi:hypothetical protein